MKLTGYVLLLSFWFPLASGADSSANRQQLMATGQCPACDLRDVDLTGVRLMGADLRNADLRGANLRGVILYQAPCAGRELWRGSTALSIAAAFRRGSSPAPAGRARAVRPRPAPDAKLAT